MVSRVTSSPTYKFMLNGPRVIPNNYDVSTTSAIRKLVLFQNHFCPLVILGRIISSTLTLLPLYSFFIHTWINRWKLFNLLLRTSRLKWCSKASDLVPTLRSRRRSVSFLPSAVRPISVLREQEDTTCSPAHLLICSPAHLPAARKEFNELLYCREEVEG